jgi:hypothetical protein
MTISSTRLPSILAGLPVSPKSRDLQLLGLHLTLAGEGMLRIVRKCLNPVAKLRRMNLQVFGCLGV